MKRFLILILSITLILSTISVVFADDINDIFTLENAKDAAVEANKQSQIDELEIKAKASELNETYDEAEDSKNDYVITDSEKSNKDIKIEVKPFEAETTLELAKRDKEENLETLKLNVYKAIMDMLLLEKELELENKQLALLEEKYEFTKAEYKYDKADEMDLLDLEYSLNSEGNDIQNIESKITSMDLELKSLMELSLDGDLIKIEAELIMEAFQEIDVDQVVLDVLESNRNIFEKSQELIAEKMTLDIAGRYFEEGDYTYDNAELKYNIALTNLEDSKRELEVSIRNKYNELLNLMDKAKLAEKYLELSEQKLKEAELKYSTETISKENLINEHEKYLKALYQSFAAVHDFNVKKAEFENSIKPNFIQKEF